VRSIHQKQSTQGHQCNTQHTEPVLPGTFQQGHVAKCKVTGPFQERAWQEPVCLTRQTSVRRRQQRTVREQPRRYAKATSLPTTRSRT